MAKELTVAEKLKNLFELQTIDSKLDEIAILRGELPVEVKDLEDEIEGLERRKAKTQEAIDELNANVNRHEAAIQEAKSLMERYSTQLDNVKNNREYEALTKELEMQKLDIQLAEKRIGQASKEKTIKEERLAGTDERMEKKKNDLKIKKKELEEIISKTDAEEKSLNTKADKARSKIEERLLIGYDRIRKNYRNGLSVVTVERDSCGGCFNRIPPQIQLEISLQKNIIACEHCGRILVDDIIAGKAEPSEEGA
jgi:predicted  nucleic acid-binding Zn-ribbon protein